MTNLSRCLVFGYADHAIGTETERTVHGSLDRYKGYDDQKLRRLARNHDIRPLIKHREFTPLPKAWNARLDSDLYYRRNRNETVLAAIKQKFGAFVRSRLWWKQFRELLIKCVVHKSNEGWLFHTMSVNTVF